MDRHIKMLGSIRTKEDFLEFMKLFIPTIQESSVNHYLNALTAWTEDMDGYYKNAGRQVPAVSTTERSIAIRRLMLFLLILQLLPLVPAFGLSRS